MSYELLNTIFARFYDFFMALFQMLNLPLNNLTASWSYYNPYSDITVSGGLPDYLNEIIQHINNIIYSWANPILNMFGLSFDSPIWQCLLVLLPIIFLIIVLIRLVVSIFKPA